VGAAGWKGIGRLGGRGAVSKEEPGSWASWWLGGAIFVRNTAYAIKGSMVMEGLGGNMLHITTVGTNFKQQHSCCCCCCHATNHNLLCKAWAVRSPASSATSYTTKTALLHNHTISSTKATPAYTQWHGEHTQMQARLASALDTTSCTEVPGSAAAVAPVCTAPAAAAASGTASAGAAASSAAGVVSAASPTAAAATALALGLRLCSWCRLLRQTEKDGHVTVPAACTHSLFVHSPLCQ
jgi:hypothetical protein